LLRVGLLLLWIGLLLLRVGLLLLRIGLLRTGVLLLGINTRLLLVRLLRSLRFRLLAAARQCDAAQQSDTHGQQPGPS
jgi:hypothetical protein